MSSSSSRSSCRHFSAEAPQKPAAGDYLLASTGAVHPWPVIICDEEMLPQDIPLPMTAKSIIEQQSPDYREGRSGWQERMLPVLYLGLNKRAWVPVEDLYPMDSEIAMLHVDEVPADLQDAHMIASNLHSLDYFKDEAIARSLACDPDADSPGQAQRETVESLRQERHVKRRKKVRSKHAKQAQKPIDNHADDDDEELFVKEEVHEGFVAGPDPEGIYDESPRRDNLSQERGSKRQRQGDRAGSSILIKEEEPEDDPTVSVHIGRSNTRFNIKRSELSKSPVLSQAIVYSIGRRPYAMNPDLMVLEERDFEAIEQYLKTSEYHPHLIHEGTAQAHLAGLNTAKERQKGCAIEVVRCGRVYCMAGFFQLPCLQDLVLRKLKTLQAYAAGPILQTTRFVFQNITDSSDPLRLHLINFIAENFRDLNQQNLKAFWETLDSSDELHIAVFRRKAEIVNDFGVLMKVEDD